MNTLAGKASLALAALLAAPVASAQPRHQAAERAYDAQTQSDLWLRAPRLVVPRDVISSDRLIDQNPDSFARDQILRDYNSGRVD